MSRRLRQEQELALQLKQEAEEEEDKIKKQQERIFAPVQWVRLTSGFKIIDIQEKMFNPVIEMIREHYIPNEVLCKNSEIEEDPVSMKSFMDHIMFTLKDSTSIAAIDENKGDALAGCLLLRVVNKSSFGRVFSRVAFKEGEARRKILELTTALNRKVDVFKLCNCEKFIRIYLLCVKNEYRKKNLGYQLMRIGLNVARSLNVDVACGIFSSFNFQRCAKRLDFKVIQEVSYTTWLDKNNELIFSDPGAGNYTCALMVCEIPSKQIEDKQTIKELSPWELRVVPDPRTRLEKRNRLDKPAKLI